MSITKLCLLKVFSIDFSGLLPITLHGIRYLLVRVECLKGWPVVKPMEREFEKEVNAVTKEKILYPFGDFKIVASDSDVCFMQRPGLK